MLYCCLCVVARHGECRGVFVQWARLALLTEACQLRLQIVRMRDGFVGHGLLGCEVVSLGTAGSFERSLPTLMSFFKFLLFCHSPLGNPLLIFSRRRLKVSFSSLAVHSDLICFRLWHGIMACPSFQSSPRRTKIYKKPC